MPKFIYLTGQRYGRLTVIGLDGRNNQGHNMWKCRCDCGNFSRVSVGSLRSGSIKSCGCLQRERTSEASRTHGMSKSRLYNIWRGMKRRCTNPRSAQYSNYGGRGIKVCDEWMKSSSAFFEWAMNNGYRDDLTIDRIDNDGDYEPNNCRWTTMQVQARNSRHAYHVTIDGNTKSGVEWAEDLGISDTTAYKYLRKGECEFVKYYRAHKQRITGR